jgi:hypothetical protein
MEVAMISDILYDARKDIEDYQAEGVFPRQYEGLREEIGVVKELMEALQIRLDCPMSFHPELAPYEDRFRAVIRQVDLAAVRAWKAALLEWFASYAANGSGG